MIRDKKHLSFVRKLPCCACLNIDTVQAAHIRIGTGGGTGIKPDDCYTVPLCHECHSRQHSRGEVTFWGEPEKAIQLSNALYIFTGDREKAIHHIIRFNRVFRNPR